MNFIFLAFLNFIFLAFLNFFCGDLGFFFILLIFVIFFGYCLYLFFRLDILELDYGLDDDELTKDAKTKDQKDPENEESDKKPVSNSADPEKPLDEEKPAHYDCPFLWITGLSAAVKANDIRNKLDETPEITGTIKNIKGKKKPIIFIKISRNKKIVILGLRTMLFFGVALKKYNKKPLRNYTRFLPV